MIFWAASAVKRMVSGMGIQSTSPKQSAVGLSIQQRRLPLPFNSKRAYLRSQKSIAMENPQVLGRLYVLPVSREFEFHQVAAGVISGRIAQEIPAAHLAQFNGTGTICFCLVGGDPLTLLVPARLP